MPRQTDSRERLLRTASELIWRGSYGSTSVDDICAACGIKKGSFYHHFKSKEELTCEALETGWTGFKKTLDQCFSPLTPPLERLMKFFRIDRAHQEDLLQGRGCVCGCPIFALGTEIGLVEPVIRAKVEEILTRIAKYFESAIREAHALGEIDAPDAARAAWQVLTFWEGAMALSRINNNLRPLQHIESTALRMLGAKEPLSATGK